MKKTIIFSIKSALISLVGLASSQLLQAQVPIVRPAEAGRVPIVRPNQISPSDQSQNTAFGGSGQNGGVPIISGSNWQNSPAIVGSGVSNSTIDAYVPPIVTGGGKRPEISPAPITIPSAPPTMGLSSFAQPNAMASTPAWNSEASNESSYQPWISSSVPGYGNSASEVDQNCGCDGGLGAGSDCYGCDDGSCTTCVSLGLGLRGRSTLGLRRPSLCGPFCMMGGVANCGFDNCGYVSSASRYFQADALYWRRSDGGILGTNFGGVPNDNWNWGWRGTLGWRQDEIIGHELSYFGFQPFADTVNQTSPGGLIDARFFPAGGYNFGLLNSFYDADATSQTMQTRLHSVGFSRVRFGWDVVKTTFGMRYIWLDDKYQLASQSGANVGLFQTKAINQLIGPDLGLELLYDVGRRISFSGKVKGGLYIDFNRQDTNVANNVNQLVASRIDRTDWAGSLELGANAYFKLGQNSRLRGGYDGFWLFDVSSVTNSYPNFVTPLTGSSPWDDRTVKFHGVSFGIEFFR